MLTTNMSSNAYSLRSTVKVNFILSNTQVCAALTCSLYETLNTVPISFTGDLYTMKKKTPNGGLFLGIEACENVNINKPWPRRFPIMFTFFDRKGNI